MPPMYEYACGACSRVEEKYLTVKEMETETQRCAICLASMEKILSVPGGYSMGKNNPASSPNEKNFSSIKVKT